MNSRNFFIILFFLLIPVSTFADFEKLEALVERFEFASQCPAETWCVVKHFPGTNFFISAGNIFIEPCNQGTEAGLLLFQDHEPGRIIWEKRFSCEVLNSPNFSIGLTGRDVIFYVINSTKDYLYLSGFIKYIPGLGFPDSESPTTTFSNFIKNDFFPLTGQIISDVFVPFLLLTIGFALAIIFLKPFITFIKSFFK
jgi:hypothetical protein